MANQPPAQIQHPHHRFDVLQVQEAFFRQSFDHRADIRQAGFADHIAVANQQGFQSIHVGLMLADGVGIR